MLVVCNALSILCDLLVFNLDLVVAASDHVLHDCNFLFFLFQLHIHDVNLVVDLPQLERV